MNFATNKSSFTIHQLHPVLCNVVSKYITYKTRIWFQNTTRSLCLGCISICSMKLLAVMVFLG